MDGTYVFERGSSSCMLLTTGHTPFLCKYIFSACMVWIASKPSRCLNVCTHLHFVKYPGTIRDLVLQIAAFQQAQARAWVYESPSTASERSSFFPILISYVHLPPLRMSRAHIFSDARGTAVSGGTFHAAETVSGTVRYPLTSKLMARISGRSTSTTSTSAIGRCPMGSFPLCQIPAIGSQGVQKSSPNSKRIFPTKMAQP